MNTIKTYFNTEKENLNPNVRDFAMILDNLKEEKTTSPIFVFNVNRIIRSTYFKYSFSLVGVAAAFIIFISNTSTINTNSNEFSNIKLARTTTSDSKATKQEEVKNAISTIDDITSFDTQN